MKASNKEQLKYWVYYGRKIDSKQLKIRIILSIVSTILLFFLLNTSSDHIEFLTNALISLVVGTLVYILYSIVDDNFSLYKALKHSRTETGLKFKEAACKVLDSVWPKNKKKDDPKDELRRKQLMFSLNEIIDAKINPLVYNPGYPLLDNVFDSNGTLSITESSPAAWLDPTYNFFLLCQYVANIKKTVNRNMGSIRSISISSRTSNEFMDFKRKGEDILCRLSKVNDVNELITALTDNEVRFYLMGEDTIRNNKGIVEYLVAGHDLSGVFLFVVNEKIREIVSTKEMHENFIGDIDNPLDVAFVHINKKLFYTKRTEYDTLNTFEIGTKAKNSQAQAKALVTFVQKLSETLYKEMSELSDQEYLIYPDKDGRFTSPNISDFIHNNKNCHINIS